GIGMAATTTPQYKMQVNGDIAATAFVNISTRDAKKDISYVDDATKGGMLEKLRTIGVATYRYNTESEDMPLRMGLIAEEAPTEVLADTGKGVDIYKLSTFVLAGVQEMAKKLDDLTNRMTTVEGKIAIQSDDIKSLKDQVASTTKALADLQAKVDAGITSATTTGTTTASTTITWSDDFKNALLSFFESIGLKLENGIAYIKEVIAEKLTATVAVINNATIDSASVNALEVGSAEKRTGITLYDQLTGDPYCLQIAGGQTRSTPGKCPDVASSTAPVVAPAPGVSGSLVGTTDTTSSAPQAVQPSATNDGTTTVATEPMTAPVVDTASTTAATATSTPTVTTDTASSSPVTVTDTASTTDTVAVADTATSTTP
ncbi:MAG TPA: hypothetical protein VFA15_05460, partial [Nitrososphaera sp.]|nr:hypothetical protein [Nitrososphaera sp.]